MKIEYYMINSTGVEAYHMGYVLLLWEGGERMGAHEAGGIGDGGCGPHAHPPTLVSAQQDSTSEDLLCSVIFRVPAP